MPCRCLRKLLLVRDSPGRDHKGLLVPHVCITQHSVSDDHTTLIPHCSRYRIQAHFPLIGGTTTGAYTDSDTSVWRAMGLEIL